jgi:hypothetical protein
MRRTDPTFAEQRVLGYVAAMAAGSSTRALLLPRSMTELADWLELDKDSCTRALHALHTRGVVRLQVAPDGRYELFLGQEHEPR